MYTQQQNIINANTICALQQFLQTKLATLSDAIVTVDVVADNPKTHARVVHKTQPRASSSLTPEFPARSAFAHPSTPYLKSDRWGSSLAPDNLSVSSAGSDDSSLRSGTQLNGMTKKLNPRGAGGQASTPKRRGRRGVTKQAEQGPRLPVRQNSIDT